MKIVLLCIAVSIVLTAGYVLFFNKDLQKDDPDTIIIDEKVCGIQECHGMNLTCGSKPVDMCTEIFMVGDSCRSFFKCALMDGQCGQLSDRRFDLCKSCIQQCVAESNNDPTKTLECDSKCNEEISNLKKV